MSKKSVIFIVLLTTLSCSSEKAPTPETTTGVRFESLKWSRTMPETSMAVWTFKGGSTSVKSDSVNLKNFDDLTGFATFINRNGESGAQVPVFKENAVIFTTGNTINSALLRKPSITGLEKVKSLDLSLLKKERLKKILSQITVKEGLLLTLSSDDDLHLLKPIAGSIEGLFIREFKTGDLSVFKMFENLKVIGINVDSELKASAPNNKIQSFFLSLVAGSRISTSEQIAALQSTFPESKDIQINGSIDEQALEAIAKFRPVTLKVTRVFTDEKTSFWKNLDTSRLVELDWTGVRLHEDELLKKDLRALESLKVAVKTTVTKVPDVKYLQISAVIPRELIEKLFGTNAMYLNLENSGKTVVLGKKDCNENLRHLHLSGIEWAGKCPALKSLSISVYKNSNVNNIAQMTNLESLSLVVPNEVSAEVPGMDSLKKLYINTYNEKASVSIGSMKNLKNAYFSGQNITWSPSASTSLETLVLLSWNKAMVKGLNASLKVFVTSSEKSESDFSEVRKSVKSAATVIHTGSSSSIFMESH